MQRIAVRIAMAVAFAILWIWGASTNCGAQESVLYTFTGSADGGAPYASLFMDGQGNFFGTTTFGGDANGDGVVFKLSSSGVETVLYTFTGGPDGSRPYGGLIMDAQGNLYGTTSAGGDAHGDGVVFKLSSSGAETVLHTFTGGADGGTPYGGLIMDAQGNLYGTASAGGDAHGDGVVFKVSSSGTETVLHTFTGGADGGTPYGGLIMDAQGNLYGTTEAGGDADDDGVVFKLSSSGTETVLYTFTGGADGGTPDAGLIMDAQGNLYGTTTSGGAADGYGVVFSLSPSGKETVLYTFTGGPDGGIPESGLVMGPQGNLYGTASYGGDSNGDGVVFGITPSGKETVLYKFTGGADGGNPFAGVSMDSQGNLYSTTSAGGNVVNGGVVFKFAPGAAALQSLAFNPNAVTGGTSSTGMVVLTGNAGAGGFTVNLSSGNSAVQVPATVTVPQGQTTATFTATTTPVQPNTNVTVTASANGTNVTAVLTVNAPIATLVTINPNPVTGGNSTSGTVTINGPAPSGGYLVNLSSNEPGIASVPATVTVPAGQTSAAFSIATTRVGDDIPVTITASVNGSSASAVLTVTSIALKSVTVKPKSVVGGSLATGKVTLTKAAPTGGEIVSLASSNTAAATVPASVTVPAGQKSATFTVATNSVSSTTKVTISASFGGTTKTAKLTVKK